MFQCVQPMQVADDDLQRHHDAEEGERHLHHHAAFLDVPALARKPAATARITKPLVTRKAMTVREAVKGTTA